VISDSFSSQFGVQENPRAREVKQEAIIAQRQKRFASIMNKLCREPDMKLSQMQDLGGCRAIFSNVSAVTTVYHMYESPEARLYEEGSLRCYDYITHPKESLNKSSYFSTDAGKVRRAGGGITKS
jgi:ppGpp synthetase/RelA/SpoT-type nucleotidyltranferase